MRFFCRPFVTNTGGFYCYQEVVMIQLNLTTNETLILRDLAETCLTDLRVEITSTDNIGYKAMLKRRKDIISKLLQAINEALEVETEEL